MQGNRLESLCLDDLTEEEIEGLLRRSGEASIRKLYKVTKHFLPPPERRPNRSEDQATEEARTWFTQRKVQRKHYLLELLNEFRSGREIKEDDYTTFWRRPTIVLLNHQELLWSQYKSLDVALRDIERNAKDLAIQRCIILLRIRQLVISCEIDGQEIRRCHEGKLETRKDAAQRLFFERTGHNADKAWARRDQANCWFNLLWWFGGGSLLSLSGDHRTFETHLTERNIIIFHEFCRTQPTLTPILERLKEKSYIFVRIFDEAMRRLGAKDDDIYELSGDFSKYLRPLAERQGLLGRSSARGQSVCDLDRHNEQPVSSASKLPAYGQSLHPSYGTNLVDLPSHDMPLPMERLQQDDSSGVGMYGVPSTHQGVNLQQASNFSGTHEHQPSDGLLSGNNFGFDPLSIVDWDNMMNGYYDVSTNAM